jgi:hypothetical protein
VKRVCDVLILAVSEHDVLLVRARPDGDRCRLEAPLVTTAQRWLTPPSFAFWPITLARTAGRGDASGASSAGRPWRYVTSTCPR